MTKPLTGRPGLNLPGKSSSAAPEKVSKMDERLPLRRGAKPKTRWGDAPAEPTNPRAKAERSHVDHRQRLSGESLVATDAAAAMT